MVAAGRGWQQIAGPRSTTKRVQPKRTLAKKTSPKKSSPKSQPIKKAAPKKATAKKGVKGDPFDLMLGKMAEMYQLNIMDVEESVLLEATGYTRHDSKGYRNAKKKIKDLGYMENKKTNFTLTESGRKYLLENGDIKIPDEPKTNEEHQEQLLENLIKLVAAPKAKIEAIFETLKDGGSHAVSELLEVSEYGRADCKGYRNTINGLKMLDLLEKDGKNWRFSEKAFKFGRP